MLPSVSFSHNQAFHIYPQLLQNLNRVLLCVNLLIIYCVVQKIVQSDEGSWLSVGNVDMDAVLGGSNMFSEASVVNASMANGEEEGFVREELLNQF